jgi:DNA-binding transcriptional LysR family regulator
MQLNEVLAFVTVVRLGSFTSAGRRLGVPKSTLSRQLARLEERLGARLVQRTTRKLSLTETGAAYYERCHRAIEELEDADRLVQDVSGRPRGTLRVSAPFDLARDWLTQWLAEFRARYPEIQLVLVLSQARIDLVAEGFDVGLRGGLLKDAGFVSRKLMGSDIGLFASPGYLDEHGRPTDIVELAAHDGISMGAHAATAAWKMLGPQGMVDVPLRAWLVANEWGVLRRALVDGLGIGPLVKQLARADLESGRLEQVLPEYTLDGGGLYAIYPSRHHLSGKVRAFVDFMVEKITSMELEDSASTRPL